MRVAWVPPAAQLGTVVTFGTAGAAGRDAQATSSSPSDGAAAAAAASGAVVAPSGAAVAALSVLSAEAAGAVVSSDCSTAWAVSEAGTPASCAAALQARPAQTIMPAAARETSARTV